MDFATAPGPKFSQASIRRDVSAALKPLRDALHKNCESPVVPTAELYGFKFTGCRYWKSPGQIGYVWKANYTGRNSEGVVIGGGIGEIANAMYRYFRNPEPYIANARAMAQAQADTAARFVAINGN